MIADMTVDSARRARGWSGSAGWLKDKGEPNTLWTSVAKLFATEAAVRTANTAIQVHGGSGYVDDHPVERYLRDARVTTLYEGTTQIQQLIIGRPDDRPERDDVMVGPVSTDPGPIVATERRGAVAIAHLNRA